MDNRSKRPLETGSPNGLDSLSRSISPPRTKKHKSVDTVSSPFRLTWIRDLDEESNQDAITLTDLLGDPLISECWNFNYQHDIPFLMGTFDRDIRAHVQVHVVHGFWKREDGNRLRLVEQAEHFPNVKLHVAPMPEMFGTHHSKMLIVFRRDDTAQVIIHTANMIAKDWTNMTNAAWISPILPKLNTAPKDSPRPENMTPGSGPRFQFDLLSYLTSYDRMRPTCTGLVQSLKVYDFSSVKGSLVASVPGTHEVHTEAGATAWGWSAMGKCLEQIPCQAGKSEVTVQVSSIATLGGNDGWLRGTLFKALSKGKSATTAAAAPQFKVVFPTADEIRASLDGYASGGSIHTKIQSKQQEMQLRYLRPIFHYWMADDASKAASSFRDAGRDRAAPHIKTYIRTNEKNTMDWALVTSANLSKQAWGEAAKPTGQFRIASWEIGVLVWPSLFKKDAIMKGCFKSDVPGSAEGHGGQRGEAETVVGFRMPYSLPLRKYSREAMPWVATMSHEKEDCLGQSWAV
ncbi:tyrosyl-DNA phosphodiesterase [Cordyceps militaris CM01]|uniref:Tyrosyl-DNA phosphodiesterase n=1 Tax=Cordyceps militaris (strain CM01) TaxID=983644 RepID=G3JED9_CORMM|nr:tyrosyl-DNA phosphodiesterase [Cordyceps militaris CM01]EGX92952.1 tyrosyl-DNA phosphodiesterase [Cordyceps militaris CM01]